MELRSFPEALKSIMEQRGWTEARLARELGKSKTWVTKVKAGERDTPIGGAIRMLAGVGWEVVIRPKREDPVKRREFHQRAITLAAASAVEAARSAVFIPSAKAGPLDDPAYVRVLAGRFLRDYDEIGGVPLASIALGHVRRIENARDGKGRALQSAEAELLANASLILYDARRIDQAERTANIALGLARNSQDLVQQIRAYKFLDTYAERLGHYDRAAMYTQRALRLPELEEMEYAELSAQRARALAMGRGDTRTVREMLDQANNSGDHVDVIGGFDAVAGCCGLAFHHLGERDASLASLGDAVRLQERYSTTRAALWLATRVNIALATDKPALELAIPDILTLARMYPLVASAHLAELVVSILKASSKWNNLKEMRDARDQLRAVITAPIPKRT